MKLGWVGPRSAKCKTKNRSHAATFSMVQGVFWKLKQTVERSSDRPSPYPSGLGRIRPPLVAASSPLCPFAIVTQYRGSGSEDLFSLRGLSVTSVKGKPLIPMQSFEPWITSGRRLQLAFVPKKPMLRPHLSVGCLGCCIWRPARLCVLYHPTQGRLPVSTPVSRPRSQSARSHGSLILLVSGPGECGPKRTPKRGSHAVQGRCDSRTEQTVVVVLPIPAACSRIPWAEWYPHAPHH